MTHRAINREAAAAAIDAFLRAIGRDPEREPELIGTGTRVADAFCDDLLEGYEIDVDSLLAHNVIPGSSDLVVVRDIAVTTTCPHHLMPAIGTATIAFAPKDHILGIGTVAKLVDAFAHRLALQERIGDCIATALQKHLSPHWVGCRLVLTHSCMTARGDRKHGARVETVSLAGRDVDEALVYAVLGATR